MKLFLSIPLPNQAKREFIHYLKPFSSLPARWVKEENLHITFLFIGMRDEKDLSFLIDTIERFTKNASGFTLHFARVTFFPSRNPRMIWGEFREDERFAQYAHAVTQKLHTEAEKKSIPHVTLARLKEHLHEAPEFPPLNIEPVHVDAIDLMLSEGTPQGQVYKQLKRFPLCATSTS